MKRIPVIDSHTGGEPTRVVLSGVTADELETYRRAIICEPRGHEVIVGALLAGLAHGHTGAELSLIGLGVVALGTLVLVRRYV
jgi:proline racemase